MGGPPVLSSNICIPCRFSMTISNQRVLRRICDYEHEEVGLPVVAGDAISGRRCGKGEVDLVARWIVRYDDNRSEYPGLLETVRHVLQSKADRGAGVYRCMWRVDNQPLQITDRV
jgi:hypothetical protein